MFHQFLRKKKTWWWWEIAYLLVVSENFTNCCMHEIFLKHVENGCDNCGDLCTAQQ